MVSWALVVGLIIAGSAALGWVASNQQRAPRPPAAAAAGTLGVPASPPSSKSSASSPPVLVGPVLEASIPTAIRIPRIKVNSSLLRLGLDKHGNLAVPQPGPHLDQAAWFTDSSSPGTFGPSIIEGHVDSVNGPSVFYSLSVLTPGDKISVKRADGLTAVFTVNAVRRYPKNHFPTVTVFGDTDRAALRLITCGGNFDRATDNYDDNVVVFAHLTGSHH